MRRDIIAKPHGAVCVFLKLIMREQSGIKDLQLIDFLLDDMKTIIISCVILIVFLLYVGHLSITIKPFGIQLPYWHRSLGLFLLILSFLIYNIGERAKGYTDGLERGTVIMFDAINKHFEEKKHNKPE